MVATATAVPLSRWRSVVPVSIDDALRHFSQKCADGVKSLVGGVHSSDDVSALGLSGLHFSFSFCFLVGRSNVVGARDRIPADSVAASEKNESSAAACATSILSKGWGTPGWKRPRLPK